VSSAERLRRESTGDEARAKNNPAFKAFNKRNIRIPLWRKARYCELGLIPLEYPPRDKREPMEMWMSSNRQSGYAAYV
jgi:hypothetical protein